MNHEDTESTEGSVKYLRELRFCVVQKKSHLPAMLFYGCLNHEDTESTEESVKIFVNSVTLWFKKKSHVPVA